MVFAVGKKNWEVVEETGDCMLFFRSRSLSFELPAGKKLGRLETVGWEVVGETGESRLSFRSRCFSFGLLAATVDHTGVPRYC